MLVPEFVTETLTVAGLFTYTGLVGRVDDVMENLHGVVVVPVHLGSFRIVLVGEHVHDWQEAPLQVLEHVAR